MEESKINMAISVLEEIADEIKGVKEIVINKNDGDAYWHYMDNDDSETIDNTIFILRQMVARC